MWIHNLNQSSISHGFVDIDNCRRIVHKTKLGSYFGSIVVQIHSDLKSKYYSTKFMFKGGFNRFVAIFTSNGIICISAHHHSGTKTSPGFYTFSGVTGFISANDIANVHITKGLNMTITIIRSDGIIFTLASNIAHWLPYSVQVAIQEYSYNMSQVTVAGNIFDLDDDPSFAENADNIAKLKANYGDYSGQLNNQLVGIKARYTSAFNSDIFKDCIHFKQYFIASLASNYILLFKVKRNRAEHLFFFTGENYLIPNNYLINEAIYIPSPTRKWIILVSPTFILTLSLSKKLHQHSFKYLPADVLSSYIGSLDPIILPKLEYRQYIKKEYAKIAQDYRNESTSENGIKAYFNNKTAKYKLIRLLIPVIIWTIYFVPSLLELTSIDTMITLGATFIAGLFCFCAWYTYLHSQVIGPKVSIILTIIMILTFPIVDGTTHTFSSIKNQKIASRLVKQVHGTYYLATNSVSTDGNFYQKFPTKFKIHNHHVRIYTSKSLHPIDYKETGAAYNKKLILHLRHNGKNKHLDLKVSPQHLFTDSYSYVNPHYAEQHSIKITTPQSVYNYYASKNKADQIIRNYESKCAEGQVPFGYVQIGNSEYKARVDNNHLLISTARYYTSARSFNQLTDTVYRKITNDEDKLDNFENSHNIRIANDINHLTSLIEPTFTQKH